MANVQRPSGGPHRPRAPPQ